MWKRYYIVIPVISPRAIVMVTKAMIAWEESPAVYYQVTNFKLKFISKRTEKYY